MIALRAASSNLLNKSAVVDELKMFDAVTGVTLSGHIDFDAPITAKLMLPIEMEGYLTKKGSGSRRDSFIGRRNWKKRWFVLRAGELKYYESYDAISEEPVSEKGTFSIVDAVIKAIELNAKDLSFSICQSDDRVLNLCADTVVLRSLWIEALTNAAAGRFNIVDHLFLLNYFHFC